MMIVKYNLQYFGKDGPGGEKTEPATEKKLSDARNDGNVAKSKDMVQAVSLIALFILLKVFIGTIGGGLLETYKSIYSRMDTFVNQGSGEINRNTIVSIIRSITWDSFLLVLPLFVVGFMIAFLGDLLQVKWKITTKPLQPKMSKINPLKGFKKIFSLQSVVNFGKSLALIVIIGIVVIQELSGKIGFLFNFYDVPLMSAINIIGDTVLNLGLKISIIYLVVGILDYVYQKIKFKNDMKMSKQEVKDEYKQSEGDPQVKGQIKQKMLQASRRRMMNDVPNADVVITNPTHFAVALKYDLDIAKAPIVLAKGEDFLAMKIKEKARECKIEIVENKPLARALYANVDVGEEIPEELYQAVAEVLAYVYNLKNKNV